MAGQIAKLKSWNKRRLTRRRERRDLSRPDLRAPLAVMGIVKNESRGIDEWIEHYLWQGADHIYVIDNGSTDDTAEKIRAWAETGKVTLHVLRTPYKQREHYVTVFRKEKLRRHFKWLLIADADEFWYSPSETSVAEVLMNMQAVDVIYCNWLMFGCSADAAHPKSLRAALVQRDPKASSHINSKWVARTNVLRNGRGIGIHKVRGADSARTITEHESLCINHYVTQSLEYWQAVKMDRGDVLNPASNAFRTMDVFQEHNAAATYIDRRLSDQIKAASEPRPMP